MTVEKKPADRSSDRAHSEPEATLRRRLLKLNLELLKKCQLRAELLAKSGGAEPLAERLARSTEDALRDCPSGPLKLEALRTVMRELDSATSVLRRTQRVAYLGPEFSYSHLAAIARYGQSTELIPVSSIGGVFTAVDRKDAHFGIVPLENSTDGRIVDTLEMFVRTPVRICGEVPVRIHHCLLGNGALAEVQEVHSKPQALSQCRNWLERHLPHARLVATASTTAAAEQAARQHGVAAIASQQAGVNYQIPLLASDIEDNPDNVTRLAVIGPEPAARTGRDKTSLMFELAHQPGSLAEALVIFKRHRLNLTWIESFPKKGSPNEYLFFVELDGHERDLAVRRAIKSLQNKTVRLEILGSYPKAQNIF
jgi:chorismate mutase/prephenate dehydratase